METPTLKFKPLLAEAAEDLDALAYPLYASPKFDGIRCVIRDGVALSRSLKPIPNRFIQSILARHDLNGLDGELMVNGNFQDVTSGIMSADGEPDFTFWVFDDCTNPDEGFVARDIRAMQRVVAFAGLDVGARIRYVDQRLVTSRTELDEFFQANLARGYEGVMVRSLSGRYKFGRSTLKEGILLKLKPFEDAEATVVGFEERMHNANEAKTNALGRTERSSHKENLVPMGTLGALVVKNDKLWPGKTFNIGTGFTDEQRKEIWALRTGCTFSGSPLPGYLGRTVKFKYQAIGTKDVPRIPVFLGFRDARDMS
jgi:DNA ligase-1